MVARKKRRKVRGNLYTALMREDGNVPFSTHEIYENFQRLGAKSLAVLLHLLVVVITHRLLTRAGLQHRLEYPYGNELFRA